MLIDIQPIQRREFQETQPLSRRIILITGASRGTGLEIAKAVYGEGGEVIIGASRLDRYKDATKALNGDGVFPFVADLSNPSDAQDAVYYYIEEGIIPTDLVFAAASGLENVLSRDMMVRVLKLAKMGHEEKQSKVKDLKNEIEAKVQTSTESARKVNFISHRAILENLVPFLRAGSKVIFLSSLWSDLFGEMDVPGFYRAVASTKREFIDYLIDRTPSLLEREIYPAIVSGNLLPDAGAGDAFFKLAQVLPEYFIVPDKSKLPSKQHMVQEVLSLLSSDPCRWPRYPYSRFVIGPNQVEDSINKHSDGVNLFKINL